MRLVVDASVATKWLLPEDYAAEAALVNARRFDLLAPELLFVELASALRKRRRRGELSDVQSSSMIDLLMGLPIKVHSHKRLAKAALELAAQLDHALYDCVYLALGVGESCPVVTADRRLHDRVHQSPLRGLTLWIEDVP